MTIHSTDFASMLCSRLCHDLLSPIGALNNGLELLADETDPEMREKCIDLLNESATVSANKLKFFRLAFGSAGGFGESVDMREARQAIEGMYASGGRTELGWLVNVPTMSKSALKVLLNLTLIMGDVLVRGGRLDIGAEPSPTGIEIAIRGEGPRLILDPELRAVLLGEREVKDMTPRSAPAYLVQQLVDAGGGKIMVSDASGTFLLFGASLRHPK